MIGSEGSGVELREFPEGAAPVVAGWACSAEEVGLLSGRNEYPFPVELVGSWRDRSEDIRAFGYFDSDELVGYGEVWLDAEEDEVELARIILAPAVRGKGLGVELVRELLEPAMASGFGSIFLRVRPDNGVAIRTYERVGFRRVAVELENEWNAAQPIAYRWMEYPAG